MIKLKNLYLGFKCQLPLKRAFKNFFITRNAWGMFSKNSHINQHTGQPKISYSYESAIKIDWVEEEYTVEAEVNPFDSAPNTDSDVEW